MSKFIVRALYGICLTAILSAGSSVDVCAQQSPDLVTPPANILLSNYSGVPLGPNAGLENGSYVARVGDPSAAWINPAGLSRAGTAQISGASGVFQVATVSPKALPNPGGSIQNLPSVVGFTVPKRFGGRWTLGVAILTPTSWAPGIDSQIVTDRAGQLERLAYSADSQYHQIVGVASLGYVTGRWRLGAGFALTETNISRREVVSDRVATDTSFSSVLIDSRTSGTAIQGRPLFGVQYDASPHLRFGAAVRARGFTFYRSGSYTADALADDGTGSQGISFFDPNAAFTYRFPLEIHGGAAYVSPRVEIELDLHGFSRIGTYSLLSSAQPIITYASPGAGAPPVVGTRPFSGFTSQSEGVVNVSAGGHLVITSNGVWRVHFGVETDRSPVGPNDQVFTHVDMYGAAVGLSGTRAGFEFTVGVDYRAGSSDSIILRHFSVADATATTIRIQTIGLIYSLAYRF